MPNKNKKLQDEATKCDERECKKCEVVPSVSRMGILRDLTRALQEVFGPKDTLLNRTLKAHLGGDPKNHYFTIFSVSCYEKWQAAFAVQEFIGRFGKKRRLVSYDNDGNKIVPPDREEVEIKRGVYKPLLTFGWYFFEWKGIPFAAIPNYGGRNNHTTFWCHKRNMKKVTDLVTEIIRFMRDHNYLKGEKLKVVDGCVFEFLEYPSLTLDDIVLNTKFKEELALNLLFPLKNEALCKEFSIPWRRGVLIAGEPGTGKTKLNKVLCNLLDCTVLWVSTESIKEAWEVKQVFEGARKLSPTLIVFEDIDFLGTDREVGKNPILGELLNQLDGNSPNNGIFVIASTNRPHLLDNALANRPGRFDLKLELVKPDQKDREILFNLFIKGKPVDPCLRLSKIAEETDGLTGSHLQEIVTYGMLSALQSGSKVLTESDLRRGLQSVKGREQGNVLST